ncbi:MAG TPA: hypothetical protein DHW42_03620 [Candidatus Marinimicrobia bacterium]|nr:hypothetical protein [Candidatus Neomarinimicrobiota bacterium]
MKKILINFCILPLILFSQTLFSASPERPCRENMTYFINTPNQLDVYRLYGRNDGNTILILGGIQGDEPGGFLSADLYPNLVLEKGNLIIVPRANFHSIIRNDRGVNGDMNRRFDSDAPKDIDDRIVEIIKGLMAESDLFLNLHDGFGYYSDTYVDNNRNPDKFGQSIIADASEYITERDTLYLEKLARAVLEKVNRKISDPNHHLQFMNTKTFEHNTRFPEQKKSATYFALSQFGIPAFGVETSKNLGSLELKIRYHNYVINEFLKLFSIEPEHPAIIYEPPRLIYLMVSINDKTPIVLDNQSTLTVFGGDKIKITHIESNYDRGLSCDILGIGDEQDFKKKLVVEKPTRIIVRKDNHVIGKINLNVDTVDGRLFTYILEINGKKQAFFDGQTVPVKRSDQFKILNVLHEKMNFRDYTVNLKGYVPPQDYNSGEDRNYLIDTGSLRWKKYSLNGAGKIYPIVVVKNERELSRIFISIE